MNPYDTLFYYCYWYTVKVKKDDEPFAFTNFFLSACLAIWILGITNLFYAKKYCEAVDGPLMAIIFIIILVLNYLYFNRSGRSRKIVERKPEFFGGAKVSLYIFILFLILTVVALFVLPMAARDLALDCKGDFSTDRWLEFLW